MQKVLKTSHFVRQRNGTESQLEREGIPFKNGSQGKRNPGALELGCLQLVKLILFQKITTLLPSPPIINSICQFVLS